MTQVDMQRCREAAELWEKLSLDVSPEFRESFLSMANRLRRLPSPFETDEYDSAIRKMVSDELVHQSLIMKLLGHGRDLASMDQMEMSDDTREAMVRSGLIAAVTSNYAEADCRRAAETLGDVSLEIDPEGPHSPD